MSDICDVTSMVLLDPNFTYKTIRTFGMNARDITRGSVSASATAVRELVSMRAQPPRTAVDGVSAKLSDLRRVDRPNVGAQAYINASRFVDAITVAVENEHPVDQHALTDELNIDDEDFAKAAFAALWALVHLMADVGHMEPIHAVSRLSARVQ